MARKKIALEPLDLASTYASGAPVAATDATHVDASTTPTAIGTGAHGSSLLASPADHTHSGVGTIHADSSANLTGDVQFVSGSGITLSQDGQAITIAGNAAMVNRITVADAGCYTNSGVTEEVLWQASVNFDDAAVGNITARLTGIIAASGGTGTFNLRIGGTIDTADGTIRAVITCASASFAPVTNLGSAFANPTGVQYVKLCAANSSTNVNRIKGFSFSIG